MTHFYIHIDNGNGFQRDEIGSDLPSLVEAREEAIAAGAAIVADELRDGCGKVSITLTIETATDGVVATIPIHASVG